jgi:hypothetical protein
LHVMAEKDHFSPILNIDKASMMEILPGQP